MKKRRLCQGKESKKWQHGFLYVMSFACLLMWVGCLPSRAAKVQVDTISLNLKNVTIEVFMEKMKEKTGLNFLYNSSLFKGVKPVTLAVKGTRWTSVLDRVLPERGLSYNVEDDIVVIRKVEVKEQQAQQKKVEIVTGTVVDNATNKPIPGINVYVKNRLQWGTATAVDGGYSLKVDSTNMNIIFSGIGYETQEVKYTGQKVINVRLKESLNELETVNVVSIGYGRQKKEKVASSIVSITAEELTDMPGTNVTTLLQGKLPGLFINNYTGEPGVRNEVTIRGVGTVGTNRSSAPLYVIDGIPYEQTQDQTMRSRGTNTDPLASINPNDIASIDVLKDAAATAIYGSRGANGVILVTTKAGRKGRPSLTYTVDVSVNTIPELQKVAGGNLERQLKKAIWSKYKDRDLPISVTDSLNPFWNNSTDWQELFYRNSVTHSHTFSISGGGDGVTYRASLGYTSDKGIMLGSDFERYTFNSSAKYSPTGKLSFDFGVRLSRTDRSRPNGANNALQEQVGIGTDFPTSLIPSTNSDAMKKKRDAFSLMEDKNIEDEVAPSVGLSWRFLKNFNWNSTFAMTSRVSNRETFKPSTMNGTDSKGRPIGSSFNGSRTTDYSYTMNHVLSYVKKFKKNHTMDVTVGFTQSLNEASNLYVNATKGSSDAIKDLNGYTKENTTTNSRYRAYGSESYFFRTQYDYDSKYIASFSWRADGSSRFGKNYRFAYFPSIALAYNIQKEKFMENVEWMDQFKVRWSWGITGTESGISEYLSQGEYKVPSISYNDAVTAVTYNGGAVLMPDYIGGIANPDLTWEEAEQYNIGTDIGLFGYRLNASFDAYWKESRDILFNATLPNTSGYNRIYKNATKVVNYGYEFSIGGQVFNPQTSPFKWETRLNGSINKNYITELPDNNKDFVQYNYWNADEEPNLLRVGRPANGFFVYVSDGVYATDADVPVNPYTGYPITSGNTYFQAGDPIIRDLDNNGKIYEVTSSSGNFASTDRTFCGSPYPKISGGWTNTFSWKNLSVSVNFVYSYGRKILNLTKLKKMEKILQSENSNMYDYTGDNHWEKPGDVADNQVLDPKRFTDVKVMYTYRLDKYIENASYLSLNNLRIGYRIDGNWLKRYSISSLSVYLSGTNLWMLTDYSGPDPQNVYSAGVDDGRGYARPRRFNFGLNISF